MLFPFSFSFAVPGMRNPFVTTPSRDNDRSVHAIDATARPSPRYLSPPQPLARKRAWSPSTSQISLPAATPAKMAQSNEEDVVDPELPPPKRRRTLAGSIVSTALSAALIGSAVGLTVYRLWRNRGKHPDQLPPPPYEQGEWVPPSESAGSTPVTKITPPTPRSRKQQRRVAGRRTVPRHRKSPSQPHPCTPPRSSSPVPPESQFPADADEAEVEDQMDWVGDQLAKLIQEGKRALGTQVVVMSESQEDEVDDGSPAWVEDDDDDVPRFSSHSPSRSVRRRKAPPRNILLPPSSPPTYAHAYASPHASPRKHLFSSPRRAHRGASVDSDGRGSMVGDDDDALMQSPELRESMERARARYQQRLYASGS